MSEKTEQKKGFSEFLRKQIVKLKRNPSIIPLLMLTVSFLVYSLNLTHVSDTTAKIQLKGMGLCEFAMMLMNILAFVCVLNSYPRRKKPNIPMIVLFVIMMGIIVFCSIHYCNQIVVAVKRAESPLKLTDYMKKAYSMLGVYRILIIITAVLEVTLPIYSKWIKKINTSVEVEGNENMHEIEIEE